MGHHRKPPHLVRRRSIQVLVTSEVYLRLLEVVGPTVSVSQYVGDVLMDHLYPEERPPAEIVRAIHPCLRCGAIHERDQIRVGRLVRHDGLIGEVAGYYDRGGRIYASVRFRATDQTLGISPCRLEVVS